MVGTCLCVTHRSLAALVDELRLLDFQALSGHQRLSSLNDGYVLLVSLFVHCTCSVTAVTRASKNRLSTPRALVLSRTWSRPGALRCVCASPLVSCAPVTSNSCRRLCLLLAGLFVLSAVGCFHPLWVRSFFRCFNHASRCSGPRSCIALFWTSAFAFWFLVSVLLTSLLARRRRCCCGLLDGLVCLSVCLPACHALRDVTMAFHELFRTVRMCTACSFTCCAACRTDQLFLPPRAARGSH